MNRAIQIFCITVFLLYTGLSSALPTERTKGLEEDPVSQEEQYQVDVILFQNMRPSMDANEKSLSPILKPDMPRQVGLSNEASCQDTPYCLLPASKSQLRQSLHALKRNPDYQVIAQYSWLQKKSSNSWVQLPEERNELLSLSGAIKINKGAYYYVNSYIRVWGTNPAEALILNPHARFKAEQRVYLDHPQIGILVFVHEQDAKNAHAA